MALQTTFKVALLTPQAGDDTFTSGQTGLDEDYLVADLAAL